MAVEDKLAVLLKVTVPGPETLDQVLVRVLPVGRPSSLEVPDRVEIPGRVMVWSTPALTEGGWFTGAPLDVLMRTNAPNSGKVDTGKE